MINLVSSSMYVALRACLLACLLRCHHHLACFAYTFLVCIAGNAEEGEVDANASPSKRKRRQAELNPDATLEPSLDALNIKKFDLAFAVDPLFHKTSAQFDEGGAKGLLLNNLSVYRGCEIVFDSMDIPEAAVDESSVSKEAPVGTDALVTLDAATIQLISPPSNARISPTLDDILALLGAAAPPGAAAAADEFVRRVADNASSSSYSPFKLYTDVGDAAAYAGTEGDAMETDDGPDQANESREAPAYSAVNEGDGDYDYGGGFGGSYDDVYDSEPDRGHNADDSRQMVTASQGEPSTSLDEDAIGWLIAAGGETSTSYITASKGWAGASHWRYRVPASKHGGAFGGTSGENGADEDEETQHSGFVTRRGVATTRTKKSIQPLDFVALMSSKAPTFEMLPPGGGRRRTAKAKAPAKTLLPEDYHYKPEFLARYALRPRTAVSLKQWAAAEQASRASLSAVGGQNFELGGMFDDALGDNGGDGYYDDGDAYGGEWDDHVGDALDSGAGEEAQAAHRVERVEVNYSRAAKQVDVRALKELMWNGMQSVLAERSSKDLQSPIEFAEVLATVPAVNPAGRLEDLSVHLCFICVLHLANEHGLTVGGVPELDRLHLTGVVPAVGM